MKMGNIPSPCPYDAATHRALQSLNLRKPAILRYASRAGSPISHDGPVTLPRADLSPNPRIDVMGQKQTSFENKKAALGRSFHF
jgi:hypothetical protein